MKVDVLSFHNGICHPQYPDTLQPKYGRQNIDLWTVLLKYSYTTKVQEKYEEKIVSNYFVKLNKFKTIALITPFNLSITRL